MSSPSLHSNEAAFLDLKPTSTNGKNLGAVIANLRFEELQRFLVRCRREHAVEKGEKLDHILIKSMTQRFGELHLLFRILFNDGAHWVLKIPERATRKRWNTLAVRELRAEAMTLQLLDRETSVPAPKVIKWSVSIDNEIFLPYILMEFVQGIQLKHVWNDAQSPADVVHKRRVKVLNQLATYMLQLDKYSMREGGMLLFDMHGKPMGVGPERRVDWLTERERAEKHEQADGRAYIGYGPFDTPQEFYTCAIDEALSRRDDYWYNNSELFFLRELLATVPEPDEAKESFVLSRPSLHMDDVVVSADGDVLGITGWHGTRSLAQSLGNKKYPTWLMGDLTQHGEEEDAEVLRPYREIYNGIIASARAAGILDKDIPQPSSEDLAATTRNSVSAQCLFDAAQDPERRGRNLSNLYRQVWGRIGVCNFARALKWEVPFTTEDGEYLWEKADVAGMEGNEIDELEFEAYFYEQIYFATLTPLKQDYLRRQFRKTFW